MNRFSPFLTAIIILLAVMTPISLAQTPANIILHIAWHPDGRKIAIASTEGLKVIDVESGETLAGFEVNENVATVDWKPDGSQLMSGRRDGIIDVWDADTGQLITSFNGFEGFPSSPDHLVYVKWSPNGKKFASLIYYPESPNLRLWNANAFELQAEIDAGPLVEVLWSSDSSTLYGAHSGPGSGVFAFDAELGRDTPWRSIGRYDIGLSIALRPNGSQIAIGSALGFPDPSRNIHVLDLTTEEPVVFLEGHTGNILELTWNSSTDMLASASLDGTVRLWDVDAGQQVNMIEAENPVYTVAWSPDGTQLAYGGEDGMFEIVDIPLS